MSSDKDLHQMTTDELGKLFPIVIEEFDNNWKDHFDTEKNQIQGLFAKSEIASIEHIGSTAIRDLKSKPTVDILMEVSKKLGNAKIIERLDAIGYQYIKRLDNPPPHMMFVKGYTTKGFKGQVYHIHVRYKGDWDEIYFRDYIRENSEIRIEYEDLKLELAAKFRNDREAYTKAKSTFIKKINKLARDKRK